MFASQLFEGVGIALAALRGNKMRAALTILGVAIGVMVVMVIASMITGINNSVARLFEESGTRTFYVVRYFSEGITVSDGSDEAWRRRPHLNVEEAQRIAELPSVSFVAVQEWWSGAAEFGSQRLESVSISGRSEHWPDVTGGDVYPGRSYTRLENLTGARVAVINGSLAERLFGLLDPIGRTIKLSGEPFRVIGVFLPAPNLFSEGDGPRAIIPHGTLLKYLKGQSRWMEMIVKAADTVAMTSTIDDVTATLRAARSLRPMEENSFDILTQDKLLEAWDRITGVFFLVMIVLSGVGLMVGGVGVVAIMMISVTERTREIGVRKALGATRREILWQFLVEAATVTLVGGAVGMVLGGLIALAVSAATPIPAEVPLWSVVAALVAAALTGILFGLYPAAKAAKLDPVEALRYE